MARTDRCLIFREGSLNFHTQELKSGSYRRCEEPFKLHVHEMGPVCRPRFKTSKEESEVEDNELSDNLRKEELLDHDNCMWLSSGGASSPSSCFQDNVFSGYMDPKIDAWFISLLSTPSRRDSPVLSTGIAFFDGSRVNPIEEASLVLDQRTLSDEDEDLFFHDKLEEEEEVVSWLVTSIENENESSDTFATCSCGDAESSYGQSSVKDSTDFHNFSCYLSKQTSDKRSQSELGCFQFDFATSVNRTCSFSSATDSSDEHSLFSSSSSSNYSSEIVDLEEIGTDNPLFWPSDWASDWSSDTAWDLFIMSPRKDISKVGSSQKTSPHVQNLRIPKGESHSEKGCNRRLAFGTHSKRWDGSGLKNTNCINDIKKKRSMPLRLRKSTKSSTKIVPLHNEADFAALSETKFIDEYKSMDAYSATSTAGSEPHQMSDETSKTSYARSIYATPVYKGLPLSASSVDHDTEAVAFDYEETKSKTPVFWPSRCASKWNSDTKWDLFIMSPPKYLYKVGKSPKTSPDTLRLRVLNGNTELQKGCSRRLEFSSSSKSSTNIKEGPTNRSMASKSKNTKTVAIGDENDTTKLPEVEVLTRKSVSKHKIVLEDLLLVDKLNVEGAIEDVLGLGEFDGHEGVESGFNKNDFSFVDIL